MQIILAQPRGFCAGVDRAIEIVEKALEKYGAPVYVRHEIVHNKFVVDNLRKKGAVFVDEVIDIPDDGVTIFSAHGVSDKVEEMARVRALPVIDATCPLVTKVHKQAKKNEKQGRQIILIGHAGHPEVEGTSGKVEQEVILVQNENDAKNIEVTDPKNLSYVTQTTLSVNETKGIIKILKERFSEIEGPETKDICYATQNRQDAVSKLAKKVDILLVVGAKNSSNSSRLKDLGEELGTESYLIADKHEINLEWLKNKEKIGLTAGASAPEILVQNVIDYISENFKNVSVNTMEGIEENIHFHLPKELREQKEAAN